MTNNILTEIIRDFILHESFVVSTCNKESNPHISTLLQLVH